jgi:DNA-binding GntR family transcriptional regulator
LLRFLPTPSAFSLGLRLRSHLQISQEEIGHLSGLSRQRVNHALHVLQEAGLLRVEHIGITVVDLDGLRGW